MNNVEEVNSSCSSDGEPAEAASAADLFIRFNTNITQKQSCEMPMLLGTSALSLDEKFDRFELSTNRELKNISNMLQCVLDMLSKQ